MNTVENRHKVAKLHHSQPDSKVLGSHCIAGKHYACFVLRCGCACHQAQARKAQARKAQARKAAAA